MTNRIYYTDPMCREFSAAVVESLEWEGKPAVCLDRTAFYPTSGGQPFDTGTIGPRRVTDVIDEDHRVVHVLDEALSVGTLAHCVIDWARRFDHMQQHTGQHVLSAAFDRLTGNPTVSFHMGGDVSTIDLAHDVKPGDVEMVESEANRVVWSDEPVAIRFASAEEAARLPLRKEPGRTGTLRLIDIADFDLSACGGTHVRRTGAIGIIAIVHVERFKGGARVGFACGDRALRSHRTLRTAVAGSVRVLSVVPTELPAAIERMQVELKEHRKTIRELRDTLAVHEAQALLQGAPIVSGTRIVVRSLDGYDAASLKSMAAALIATPAVAVALFSDQSPAQVVVARSADVSLDAGVVLRSLIGQYGGKGGGKADIAQGGGLTGDLRQILWSASGLLEESCTRGGS